MAFDLGKALSGVSDLGTGREQIEYIRLSLLEEDPNNFYQLSDVDQLAANIELCGLQQPIRVRLIPGTDRYMIVSGHRRCAAIKLLAKDNPEKWDEVACIVERNTVSPALQQLRLIYANSNTRSMTAAEISEQAVQVEKLLYQLKEEGYEFPGRMRDHVAEAVGASKSKLARLKVIRDRLSYLWLKPFKEGELDESPAYCLAQMPLVWQEAIYAVHGLYPYSVNEPTLQEFKNRFAAIDKVECKHNGSGICVNKSEMREKSCKDRWSDPCHSRCCFECANLRLCGKSCINAAERKKELKEAATQEANAKAESERPAVEQVSALWQRFGLAREMAFKDFSDCKQALGIYYFPYDDDTAMQLECGEAKINPNTKLPYGYSCYLPEINRIIALADLFGCSIDWLFCRTDVKDMATEGVSESGAENAEPQFIHGVWYPATVEPPVGVELVLIDSGGYADTGKYNGCGEYTMDFGDPVTLWTLMPQEKDAAKTPPAVTGWQTGTPRAYGTYVTYIRLTGVGQPLLRELLWDGEEWFMFGQKISEDVTVQCWMERPDF